MSETAARRASGEITAGERFDRIEAELKVLGATLGRIEQALVVGGKVHEGLTERLDELEEKVNDDEKGLAATRTRGLGTEARVARLEGAVIGVVVFVLLAVGGALLGTVVGARPTPAAAPVTGGAP